MKLERYRQLAFRLSQAVGLAGMGLLGLIDLVTWWSTDERPRLWLVFVQAAITLATVATWLPRYPRGSRLLPVLVLTLGIASIVVTVNRFPKAQYVTAPLSLSEAAGFLLTLVVLARRGAVRWAIPAAGVVVLALGLQPLRSDTSPFALILGLLQGTAGAGLVGLGCYLRFLDSVRDRQLIVTRAEQRAEFARDLHDFVAHHVTGIIVQAQGARLIAEQDPARTVAALGQIEHAGAEAMTAMRRMVGMLRNTQGDAPLAPLGTLPDLPSLVETFGAAGGPPVKLTILGETTDLPVEITTSGYRVVMEALTNVRQHAAAVSAVDVWVNRTPDWLLVRVSNDGGRRQRGPSRRVGRGGFGIAGLIERVEALGGWLRAGPGVAGGWVLDAALPLRQEAQS